MSFLKGFFSLFDWMCPRTTEEQLKDLDDRMQDLYDKKGWGLYINPWEVKKVTQSEFLDEMIKLVPKEKFVPYSYYNKDLDSIQVYWKDEESYTVPTANGINLKIGFDTSEVVGVDILNANQLVIENRKPLTLDEKQRFAIWWCLDRIIKKYGDEPIIVNGININETIQQLTGRLFV